MGAAAGAARPQPAGKPRLRRKDCFFGLHFDLHPGKNDKVLGRDVTEEAIGRLLDRTRPDYVQYDCKGHAGWMGYPSEVSPSSPGIVKDSLALWRKATAERGVGLYVHFSGVWDSLAVEQHPEWARVGPDGKPDARQTSTFGPYADARMIPQLREVATKYGVDGAWVDGECWATAPDYVRAAEERFGGPLPRKPDDPRWQDFLEFNRDQFRRYVKHYTDELHKSHPAFQIASNWLYTTYVPEKPALPVDFVSGDYLGNASMETARVEARYLSSAGQPWDLMAWGFQRAQNNPVGAIHKNREHLMQEAAVVLAQGGGFQVYYQPTRAGYFDERLVDTMAAVAKFCRDRQQVSHRTESASEAAVLFSGNSLYRTSNKLFGGWPGQLTAPARGTVSAMVECQYPVDVLPDWKLDGSRYRLIVVPDWKDIGGGAARTLLRYAEAGGSLVVVGAENAKLFADSCGVRLTGDPSDQACWIAGRDIVGNMRGLWQPFEAAGGEVVEHRYPTTDTTRDATPAAVVNAVGKGRIALIPGPVGAVFAQSHAPAVRQFLQRVVARLWRPALEVQAPACIEVAIRRKGRSTIVHLSNSANMQVAGDYATTDFIPTVGPVRISFRMPAPPAEVRLEPVGAPIRGTWKSGVWTGQVPGVEIHSAVVFAAA